MPARRLVMSTTVLHPQPRSTRATGLRRISWRRSVAQPSTERSRWARRSRGSVVSSSERDHGRACRRLHLGPDRRRPVQYSRSASAPDDQEHVDWLAWRPCAAFGESGRAGSWVRYEIDVKSQRKLDEIGQTLWLICDAGSQAPPPPSFPSPSSSSCRRARLLVTCQTPDEVGRLYVGR